METTYGGFEDEYKWEKTVEMYKSISTDLIDFARGVGMENPDHASCALFLADYVITSSEVPSGLTDEERRTSIINAFITGLGSRNADPKLITKIFYLSQKIGTTLKRTEGFLSSRGLNKDAGLLLLKDLYVIPYLEFIKSTLGSGNTGWELGLLASAIKQSLPDKEVEKYMELTTKGDEYSNFTATWSLLKQLEKESKIQVNSNLVIPNISDTKVLTVTSIKSKPLISIWKGSDRIPNEDLESINNLLKFLETADNDKPILFLRGEIVGSDAKLMMARNPYLEGKPLIMLKTTADEINVSETLALLSNRASELNFWQELQPETITEIIEEEVELEQEVEEIVEIPVTTQVSKESNRVKPKKKGLFSRIKSIFGSSTSPDIPSGVKTTPKTKTEVKKKKEKVKQKIKKKKDRLLPYTPNFISHAMGAVTVGDLDLFEIFDTFRETEYLIVGALESDFDENETKFVAEARLGNAEEWLNVLDGLDQVLEKAVNTYFGGENQIMPSEIFFLTKDDKRFMITLQGNNQRIVGTMAVTYEKDITDWQDEGEDPIKRRSLHMRTGQLLSARVHTPFDAAVARIYQGAINQDTKVYTLDRAILSIDN